MKLKLYTEENVKNSSDDQLFLKIEEHKSKSCVYLFLSNKKGDIVPYGSLMTFDFDDKIVYLPYMVYDDIPLKTDEYGHIICLKQKERENFVSLLKDKMKEKAMDKIILSIAEEKNENKDLH